VFLFPENYLEPDLRDNENPSLRGIGRRSALLIGFRFFALTESVLRVRRYSIIRTNARAAPITPNTTPAIPRLSPLEAAIPPQIISAKPNGIPNIMNDTTPKIMLNIAIVLPCVEVLDWPVKSLPQ
jgi:hypothetical protein